jgi:hypothetical protein
MEIAMSATRNILASSLFAMPFIGYQPVNVSNGEPAVTAANLTKQTILGPPFRWAWNRSTFQIHLDRSQKKWGQDTTLLLPDFHFLEKLWLTDPTGKVTEITNIAASLAAESAVSRPSSAAMHMQDDHGNVTLRLNTLPDAAYQIEGNYQRAPVQMTSLANLWSPIPDHLSYIYDWGFLGFCSLLTKDARAPIFLSKFASHILGNQDGLTAQQRNIFLGNWLDLMNQQAREGMATQQGAMGRANA